MDKKALEKIKEVKIKVKVPKETYKIRPLQIIPLMDVKEMEIGTAEMDSRKTPYVKAKGEIKIEEMFMRLPMASEIIKFESETKKMEKKRVE
ncbi:MAG: hypothetical protein QMD80_04575 [archaeon]|nr:hypothetical protein [archaeon]